MPVLVDPEAHESLQDPIGGILHTERYVRKLTNNVAYSIWQSCGRDDADAN